MNTNESYEISLEYKLNLEDLWKRLAELSSHIVEDNLLMKEDDRLYPLSTRELQMSSIKAVISTIEETHTLLLLKQASERGVK